MESLLRKPHSMNENFSFNKYLNELSINTPTPIQTLCFHHLFEGKSVLGLAPTGSGKTLAFVLPLLLRLNFEDRNTQLLILVPTRELGNQIARVCQQVSDIILSLDKKNALVRTALGGSPVAKQLEEISKKPHVLIATPGRMLDVLKRKALNTKKLTTLVLDEADIMVGMGFSEQVELIYSQLPKQLQIALFSATQNENVTQLQENLMQNKNHIVCNVKNFYNLNKDSEQLHDSPIKHQYLVCNKDNKFQNLVLYLKNFQEKDSGKIILFCHQRDTVHSLADSLKKEGLLADALTGELGQVQRNSILRNFKSGNLKYLVATNIASRGIDIEKLAAVIHYDVPFTQEDYIHRSGRTGRSGFSLGTALTLCDSRTKSFYIKLMEELNLNSEEINFSRTISQKTSPPKTTNKISFIKVHLNKGKQDKIRPGDVLGAFVQDLSFDKEDIGSIFIFTNFTHVEINVVKKNNVLNKSFKIKNKAVRAVLAK